jgi:small subunit ribosomal protein S6
MRLYEAVIILVHQATEERQKELIRKVDSVFSKYGAVIKAHHDRGRKPLGYMMKKHKEGHFYIYDAEIEPSRVSEIVRELRLEEQILQASVVIPPKKSSKVSEKETGVHAG